jgi:hypothetical protein
MDDVAAAVAAVKHDLIGERREPAAVTLTATRMPATWHASTNSPLKP